VHTIEREQSQRWFTSTIAEVSQYVLRGDGSGVNDGVQTRDFEDRVGQNEKGFNGSGVCCQSGQNGGDPHLVWVGKGCWMKVVFERVSIV
jgi:hypothetical protein